MSTPPVEASDLPSSRRKPPTVLVVEDEVLVRLMICEELRERGLRVIEAVTADQAAEVLQSSTEVDLIVSDIKMPGRLDGLALARHVDAGLGRLIPSASQNAATSSPHWSSVQPAGSPGSLRPPPRWSR